ncbi:hypothetical protein C2E21_7767 [Chlorella sorokiniana]|uniref:Uncharacterized protein n=1 Tax=Chlorella sorokiniana TaxID=3076 RepID=A0A2P6TGA0_CHLSO|nr:hypothetical protein C2E21_7767 [Chlorella sorokiniana]|eukprot:PRW33143.1 hypothetical protein C2E21_7767 [Chlorella sorokiniana]
MRDLHQARADRLRLQGIAVSTFVLLAASALPAVSYYYVFQHDGMALGPFAWTHWAIVGATCALAILAHALGSTGNHITAPPPPRAVLLAAHVALGGMLGAGLGAFDTSFWLTLSTRCTAYPTEVCDPVQQQAQKFVLAFTGLAALVLLALPVCYSLLALCCLHASAAATAARRHMVGFQVDTQTALVESGEKPTVTPAMLAAWVGYLMETEEQDCIAIGEKCRAALSARGFELPVVQKKKKKGAAGGKGLFSKKSSGNNSSKEVAVRAGGGLPPAGEAIAAAEAGEAQGPGGRNARKGRQVAADDRRVQFVQG